MERKNVKGLRAVDGKDRRLRDLEGLQGRAAFETMISMILAVGDAGGTGLLIASFCVNGGRESVGEFRKIDEASATINSSSDIALCCCALSATPHDKYHKCGSGFACHYSVCSSHMGCHFFRVRTSGHGKSVHLAWQKCAPGCGLLLLWTSVRPILLCGEIHNLSGM